MEMQYRHTADIKPNPKNPRTIKDDKFKKLVDSLREFPDMLEKRPLVCYTDTDGKAVVLGGNMRLKAAKELKMKQLPIILADNWTEEQKAEFLIKDNVSFGDWNYDELREDWDTDQLAEWGLDMPEGYDDVVLEVEEDDYEIPDEIHTDIVPGDLFEIGPHRLLCGSSTETDTWERVMAGKLADMVMTDPPYNVNYEGGTGMKIMNDDMDDANFYQFLYDFHTALGAYTKPGGGVVRLARRQRRIELQAGLYRKRAVAKAMPDMGKKRAGNGQAGLPMEARTVPLRMDARSRALFYIGPAPHHRDRGQNRHPEIKEGPARENAGGHHQGTIADHRDPLRQTNKERPAPDHETNQTAGTIDREQQPDGRNRSRRFSRIREHHGSSAPNQTRMLRHRARPEILPGDRGPHAGIGPRA